MKLCPAQTADRKINILVNIAHALVLVLHAQPKVASCLIFDYLALKSPLTCLSWSRKS